MTKEKAKEILGRVKELYLASINTGKFEIIINSFKSVFGENCSIKLHTYFEEQEDAFLINIESSMNENPSYWFSTLFNDRVYLSVILKYPSITITNSTNAFKELKDLFVLVRFDSSAKLNLELRGLRSSIDSDEYFSQYFHSHLPSFNSSNITFLKFCVGTGPIIQFMTEFNSFLDENLNLDENFNEQLDIQIKMFCSILKVYLEYESIEGGPYKRIANLVKSNTATANISSSSIHSLYLRLDVKKLLYNKEVGLKLIEFNCVKFNHGKFYIEPNTNLEKFIAELIIKSGFSQSGYPDFFASKTETRNYVSCSNDESTITYQKTPIMKFNGEDVFFNVKINKSVNKNLVANKQVTNYICSRWTERINKTFTTSNRTEGSSPLNPIRTITQQNTVSV